MSQGTISKGHENDCSRVFDKMSCKGRLRFGYEIRIEDLKAAVFRISERNKIGAPKLISNKETDTY